MSSTRANAASVEAAEDDRAWIDEGFLKQVLGPEVNILHVDVDRATAKGDNYLSVIYRSRVEYKLQESDDVLKKSLIIKTIPNSEFMVTLIEELSIFRRETSIYADVLPKFYAFTNLRLGNDSFNRFSAGFHKTNRQDILILDDLKPEGFVMASRKDRLDLPQAKLVIHTLARFHALSLAYTEDNPASLSSFDEYMYCESNRERLQQYIPPVLRDITDEVKKWKGFDKIGEKMERLQETILDKLIDICKPPKGLQNVLLHGDCWVNNILFKYSETGEPIDLRLVDFQMTNRNSPAIELQYFLFSSLRNDVWVLHNDDLLRDYYSEFRRWTRDLGYGGGLFTFDELRQEIKRTALFGFYSAFTFLGVVLADVDDVTDLDKITLDNGEVQMFGNVYERPDFRKAFEPVLLHFDERGVLD